MKHHCHVTFMVSWRCLLQQKFWCIPPKLTGDLMVWYMTCFSQEFSICTPIWIDGRNASNAAYNLTCFLPVNHTRCTQWYSFMTHLSAWNRSHLKHRHKNQIRINVQVIFLLKGCSLQLDWWCSKRRHIICDKEVSCKADALFFWRMHDGWLCLPFDMIEVKLVAMCVWCVSVESHNCFDLIMGRGLDLKRISSHQNAIPSSRWDPPSLEGCRHLMANHPFISHWDSVSWWVLYFNLYTQMYWQNRSCIITDLTSF